MSNDINDWNGYCTVIVTSETGITPIYFSMHQRHYVYFSYIRQPKHWQLSTYIVSPLGYGYCSSPLLKFSQISSLRSYVQLSLSHTCWHSLKMTFFIAHPGLKVPTGLSGSYWCPCPSLKWLLSFQQHSPAIAATSYLIDFPSFFFLILTCHSLFLSLPTVFTDVSLKDMACWEWLNVDSVIRPVQPENNDYIDGRYNQYKVEIFFGMTHI